MSADEKVELGKTGIKVSPVGLGIMQWGDVRSATGSASRLDTELHRIYQTSLELGINFIDTAEMYGMGRSEQYLGMSLEGKSDKLVIATKFMPFPWRLSRGELRSALVNSLKRLGLDHLDLYQMHWPCPPVPIKTWMDAMSDAYSDGLIRAVGVSNYSVQQVSLAQEALSAHGIPLASNQIKFSLLDQRPISKGLVDYCQKTGVTIIAYSPLEKGLLTGKYTPNNPPTGFRAWRYNRSFLEKVEPLLNKIKDIGNECGGRTSSEVALNWLVAKGAVPIPGARSASQARENAGAMGWSLTNEQISTLDEISDKVAH